MTFDWSSNDQCAMAFTGKLCLSVDTFDDGIAWSVSPQTRVDLNRPRREKRRTLFVHGLVDDMEIGKRAAEQMAERIRKGLRWAR